jgi:hypothetical protein
MPNVMMSIQAILYQSLQTVESLNLPAGEAASGKKFEDYVVKQLYQQLLQRSENRVFAPRHTLHEPTFSGVFHRSMSFKPGRLKAAELVRGCRAFCRRLN